MVWERWSDWERGDPRWSVPIIDTTARAPAETVADLAAWIAVSRPARRA
jgi:hypothetical protein